MSLTVHRPLSQKRREFRLARMKPGEHDNHPIEVALEHASLDNPPTFAALSYNWGDMKDQTVILINEIWIPTRRNLYDALYQLRNSALDTWIWIDAICINQNDDEERSWQVNEMRSIFALAETVYCWLGPAADDSDAAFRMLRRAAQEVEDCGLSMDDIKPIRGESEVTCLTPGAEEARLALREKIITYDELESKNNNKSQGAAILMKLLHRPFFSRVWIIQEFSLAKHCQFICGQKSLDARAFDIALSAIRFAACYRPRLSPIVSPWGDKFFFRFNWNNFNLKPFQVRRAIVSGSPPDLYDIISIGTECPNRPIYAASDPRDIVFGVLGCVADAATLGLRVDYRKPVNQVFAETTKALIRQRKRYKLGHCSFVKDMPGLPSWVPDWKRLGEFGVTVYPIDNWVDFAADDGLLGAHNDVDPEDWRILRTCGWYVDVVTAVMKPTRCEFIDGYSPRISSLGKLESLVSKIVEFFELQSSKQANEIAVWRTVVLDQQIPGQRTSQIWQDLAPQAFCKGSLVAGILTPDRKEFIENPLWSGTVEGFEKYCLDMMEACCRFRTLFKTRSGKIGLGPNIMLVGDIVTILHRNGAPIILRSEGKQHHSYVGEAYVQTIMDGEFAATRPKLRLFELI